MNLLRLSKQTCVYTICKPDVIICTRNSRYRDTTSICKWWYSSSPSTGSPVVKWNLTWSAWAALCLVLNASTRADCLIQHSRMPRMHLTVLWPSSWDLPLSSSMRLKSRITHCMFCTYIYLLKMFLKGLHFTHLDSISCTISHIVVIWLLDKYYTQKDFITNTLEVREELVNSLWWYW